MVIEFLIGKLIKRVETHPTGGKDLEFVTPTAKPKRPSVDVDVDTPTRAASCRTADARAGGISGALRDTRRRASGVRRIADEHGVVILFRPGNMDSMGWQALGHPAKSTEIKTKTLQEVDQHIGGPDKRSTGLVGVFEPTLPARPLGITDADWDLIVKGGRRPPDMTDDIEWTEFKNAWADDVRRIWGISFPTACRPVSVDKLIKRFTQRRLEFEDNIGSLRKLEEQGLIRIEDGLIIDTGLYGGTGKAITGDYDLFQIVGLDGRPVSPEKYRQVLDALKADPDRLVVHGAHMRWPEDAPFARGSKEAGIFDAIMAGHEHEALLMLGGFSDGLVRTTYVRQIGDGRQLITTRDGTVLWGGGFLMRPSPLETAAHHGPLSLDKVLAAVSLLRRIKPAYLAADQQGDAAPPEAVSAPTPAGEMTPEEKARYRDEQDDDVRPGRADLPPEFSGDPSLFGDEKRRSERPTTGVDALAESLVDDTASLRPVDDPATTMAVRTPIRSRITGSSPSVIGVRRGSRPDDGARAGDGAGDRRRPPAHPARRARRPLHQIEPALHEATYARPGARRFRSGRSSSRSASRPASQRCHSSRGDGQPMWTTTSSRPERLRCLLRRPTAARHAGRKPSRFDSPRADSTTSASPGPPSPIARTTWRSTEPAETSTRRNSEVALVQVRLLCADDPRPDDQRNLDRPPRRASVGAGPSERLRRVPTHLLLDRFRNIWPTSNGAFSEQLTPTSHQRTCSRSRWGRRKCERIAPYHQELLERCERDRCPDRCPIGAESSATRPPTPQPVDRREERNAAVAAIIAGAVGAAVAGGVAVVALIGSGNDPVSHAANPRAAVAPAGGRRDPRPATAGGRREPRRPGTSRRRGGG